MSLGPNALLWIGFAGCLLLAFLLSGMEAGVFALSRLRIRQQVREGKPSARALHGYLENPENFLWTILVGNTVVNFLILGWLVVVLRDLFHGQLFPFVLVFSGAVFLFYVFFDLLPKMFFRAFPNRLCLAMARPFGAVHLLLRPLVLLVETASSMLLNIRGGTAFTGHLFGNREELRLVMQESSQALSSEERTMINRVLDLQNLTVRQAMVPMEKVVSLDSSARVSDALQVSCERGLTRLPLWELRANSRRIAGVLSINTLLYQGEIDPARPASDFLRPALFLDEDLRLELALRRMQRAGERLAIVLSRDRREAGILSFQDVLRVAFGEVSL
jgi:putative hemolysin